MEKPKVSVTEEQHEASSPGDDDGDSLPDSWEDTYKHNKLNAEDADLDFDQDGLTTLEEYLNGRNPLGSWAMSPVTPPTGFQATPTLTLIATARNGLALVRVYGTLTGASTATGYPYTYDPSSGIWTRVAAPPGYTSATGLTGADVNSHGEVIGYFFASGFKGFCFTPGQGTRLFALNPGTSSEQPVIPRKISDAGYIVATTSYPTGTSVATDTSGRVITFPGIWTSPVYEDVNDFGEFVGTVYNPLAGRQETFIASEGLPVFTTPMAAANTIVHTVGEPWDMLPDIDPAEITWGTDGKGTATDRIDGSMVYVRENGSGAYLWKRDEHSSVWYDLPIFSRNEAAINYWGEFSGQYSIDLNASYYDELDQLTGGGSLLDQGLYHYDGDFQLTNTASIVFGMSDESRVLVGPDFSIWHGAVTVPVTALVPPGSPSSYIRCQMANDGLIYLQPTSASTTLLLLRPAQDTDGDGMSDDWEDVYGLNKNQASDAYSDRDGDGISNLGEFTLRTNPTTPPAYDPNGAEIDLRPGIDSDGDGIPNVWEWANGLDYDNAEDGVADFDNDGFSNFREFQLKTDPRGAPSYRVAEIGPFADAKSVSLQGIRLGSGGQAAADLPLLDRTEAVYFQGVPAASPSKIVPASWELQRRDENGIFSMYAPAGSEDVFVLARSPSGAQVASIGSDPATLVYWATPEAQPVIVSGASGGSNTRGFGSCSLSPDGAYLVGWRLPLVLAPPYESVPFIWKMPSASQSTLPVTLSLPGDGSLTLSPGVPAFHVNDQGYVAATGRQGTTSNERAILWKMNGAGTSVDRTSCVIPAGNVSARVAGISNGPLPVIAGTVTASGGQQTAVVWNAAGQSTSLEMAASSATMISTDGRVAGVVDVVEGGILKKRTFISAFHEETPRSPAGWRTVMQGEAFHAVNHHSIASSGELLGSSSSAEGETLRPTIWRAGKSHKLDKAFSPVSVYTAVPLPDYYGFSQINERGTILTAAYKAGAYVFVLLLPEQDADGDGMSDEFEDRNHFESYETPSAEIDSDEDGLSDLEEFQHGTDPRSPDTDQDGIWDGWEVEWGLNPLDSWDASLDPDGDTLDNLQEFQSGGSPTGIYKIENVTLDPEWTTSGSGYGEPDAFAFDDNGRFLLKRPTWGSDYGENYEEIWEGSDHCAVGPGAATPAMLTSSRNLSRSDWSSGVTSVETDNFAISYSLSRDSIHGGIHIFKSFWDGYQLSWEDEEYHLLPDANSPLSWINWDAVQANDVILPQPVAISPDGNYRLHVNINDENDPSRSYFLLTKSGSIVGPPPAFDPNDVPYRWGVVNNAGDCAAVRTRDVAAASGVPAHQVVEFIYWNRYTGLKVVPAPAEWFPAESSASIVHWAIPSIIHFQASGKMIVRRSPEIVTGAGGMEYHLLDPAGENFAKIPRPGLGYEDIAATGDQSKLFVGSGPQPYLSMPDGLSIRLRNLRVSTGSGGQTSALGDLYAGALAARHITSNGRITLKVNGGGQPVGFIQLVPDNDLDDDGIADDWEKYWAKYLKDAVTNPDSTTAGEINSGNLDPAKDYLNNGTSVINQFAVAAAEKDLPEEDPVTAAVKWRRGGASFTHHELTDQEPYNRGTVDWEALYYMPGGWEGPPKVILRDDEIPLSYTGGTDYIEGNIDGYFPWSSIPLTPYSDEGMISVTAMDVPYVQSGPGGVSTGYYCYWDQTQSRLWRKEPIINPTTRYFVDVREVWPEDAIVAGVRSMTVPANQVLSDTVLEVTADTVVGASSTIVLEKLEAELEVLTPDIEVNAPEGPPSHRKISLQGVPGKDDAPEEKAEEDFADEEVYVDAYDRSLNYSTSIVWAEQGGSELPLSVKLTYNPAPVTLVKTQIIDPKTRRITGFRESLSPDAAAAIGPFGYGFSSNLGGIVTVKASMTTYQDKITKQDRQRIESYDVVVVDSDGARHSFTSPDLKGFRPTPPPITAPAGQESSLAWEGVGTYQYLILSHKYGKKCRFKWAGPPVVFPDPTRTPGFGTGFSALEFSNVTKDGTATLVEVYDRLGNRLVYTGGSISHYHKNSTVPSGTILIGRDSGGMFVKDPKGNTTRFKFVTKTIGQTIKVPVLSEIIQPDGGVRRFSIGVHMRKPKTYNPTLPPPTDLTNPFKPENTKPKKRKKWTTGEGLESAIAPYLYSIQDATGRVTSFTYDEPQSIDGAQRVIIQGKVDFSEWHDLEGGGVEDGFLTPGLKEQVINAAKKEISPDIVTEMAMKGYHKLRVDTSDPNYSPYKDAEGIYLRYGLLSAPSVSKVIRSDVDGDGLKEVMTITQVDKTEDFLTKPQATSQNEASWAKGLPDNATDAANRANPLKDIRTTVVSDRLGTTTYKFGDGMIVAYGSSRNVSNPNYPYRDGGQMFPSPAAYALAEGKLPAELKGLPLGTTSTSVVLRRLSISRSGNDGTSAAETYYFDPSAGMAVSASIDASGNTVEYEYGDTFGGSELQPGSSRITVGGKEWPHAKLQYRHSDPTREIRRKGNVNVGYASGVASVQRTFGYQGDQRIQTKVVDELGRVSVQELNAAGLRIREKVYANVSDAATGTSPVSHEEFEYNDSRFPSFVTAHKVMKLSGASGDPAWVADMVTEYIPYHNEAGVEGCDAGAAGRIWKECVVLGGGTKLTTTYEYDKNGNKTSVTTPRGLTTTFVYNAMDQIVETVFHDGSRKFSEYDRGGRKTAEIDENGNRTSYRYTSGGYLTEVRRHMDDEVAEGPNDIVTRTLYDERGRATTVIDANGNATITRYDGLDRPIMVRDANGGESHMMYDLTKNPGGSAFSGSGFKPTRTRDARGYITEISYDHRYLPVVVAKEYELPSGTLGDWKARALGPCAVTETVYDDVGNATDTYVKRTATAALGSDDVMHTHVDFDVLNRPYRTTVEPNHTALRHETRTLFTSTGLAWKTIEFENNSALKREREKECDLAGRVVKEWAPAAITGLIVKTGALIPLASAQTQTGYDADGNVKLVTDPLGRITEYHYDDKNRRWKEELPDVKDFDQALATVTPTIVTTYDNVGNVLTVTDARGVVTKTDYDRANRAILAYAAYHPQGLIEESTVTATSYDKNGNVLSVTDQNGSTTRNAYDKLNRLVGTSVNPATGNPGWPLAPASGDIVVANVHDASGNLILVADGMVAKQWQAGAWNFTNRSAGHVTEFRYDGLNRKTHTIWDSGSTLEKQDRAFHDAVAQIKRTDAKNRDTYYTYDTLFRLVKTSYDSPTSTHAENHTRYYRGGTSVTASGPGLQHAVYYGDGTDVRDVTYTLNRLDQTTMEKSGNVTHYYLYDLVGNRLISRYYNRNSAGPAQIRALVSEYDALNRLSKAHETTRSSFSVYPFVLNPATDKTTSYSYDLAGNERFKSLPSGQRTTTTYDKLGRPLDINTIDGSGGLISRFDYSTRVTGALIDPSGYDNNGNVRRVSETYSDLSSRVVTNDYDRANRLIREKSVDTQTVTTEYRYDAANNRDEKEVFGGDDPGLWQFTFGDITNGRNTNQLVSYTRPSDAALLEFEYDELGNRKLHKKNGANEAEYLYDRENRLTEFKSYDAAVRRDKYTYDYRSRRVVRDESGSADLQGTKVELSFSFGTSVQEYAPGQTSPAAEHIRGSDWGGGVGGILYTIRGGQPSYCAYNSRGDVVSRTDANGDVTWQAAYEAFGTRTRETGSTVERQTANTKDEDLSGLLNEGMRYRDLEAGVFLTRDPAGFVDGPNVYTYVNQNPWTSFDPLGLWGWKALASMVLDCVPVVSTVKAAVELVAGRDIITGEKINRAEAAVSLAASFTPGGKMAVKATIKAAKVAEKAMDAVDTVETVATVAEAAATGDIATIAEVAVDAAISKVGHKKKGDGGDPGGKDNRQQKAENEVKCENDGCFVAGTPVLTPEGIKSIEEIKPGDEVWSYDLQRGEWEVGEVSRTFVHAYDGELITVNYEGGNVTATENHPFWVVSGADLASRPLPEEVGSFRWTGEGTWVCAADLREGDVLLLKEGESRASLVLSLDFRKSSTTVYNFEVARLHTYSVAGDGVLVHNNCNPFRGGAYSDVSGKKYAGDKRDGHHMPDKGADTGTSKADGPSIQMDEADHQKTSSWGSSKQAEAYRAQTKSMIDGGAYRDAMAREIRDVRRTANQVSGDRTKYNGAIREMLNYDKNRAGGEGRYKTEERKKSRIKKSKRNRRR